MRRTRTDKVVRSTKANTEEESFLTSIVLTHHFEETQDPPIYSLILENQLNRFIWTNHMSTNSGMRVAAGLEFSIQTFTLEDVDFAVRVTRKEKWGYSAEDFTLMFLMGVGDHYVAKEEESGKRVGMLSTYVYSGKLAWIGNVVVSEESRHLGVGTMLIKHAIRCMRKEGVKTIRLYSYLKSEPLYEKLGFTREGVVGVFSKKSSHGKPAKGASPPEKQLDLLFGDQIDMQQLVDFDSNCFGSDRQKVLAAMIRTKGVSCFAKTSDRTRRRIIGYIMVSEAKRECEVGPFVCDPEHRDVAEDLIKAVSSRYGEKKIVLAGSLENSTSIEILQRLGFTKTMDVIRMRKGRDLYNGKPAWIFAVGGLEKG
jgi:ribosomal protein S18 acetylase RimI-like enzyme